MTTIDPDHTLADIVTAHPRLAATFDRHGLDYCCGGATTLAEACAAAGLDLADLTNELTGPTDDDVPAEWTTYGLDRLIDHIVAQHHVPLRTSLPHIEALLDRVVGVHGLRHPELAEVQEIFLGLRQDLEPHLDQEESVVFPLIRRVATADARALEVGASPGFSVTLVLGATLDTTELEHEQVGAALADLRDLTHRYEVPGDACASYTALLHELAALEADVHIHVHKENNHLFREARWLADQTGELL